MGALAACRRSLQLRNLLYRLLRELCATCPRSMLGCTPRIREILRRSLCLNGISNLSCLRNCSEPTCDDTHTEVADNHGDWSWLSRIRVTIRLVRFLQNDIQALR